MSKAPSPKSKCPECGCPVSYHRGSNNACVMADAGGGNCGCKQYKGVDLAAPAAKGDCPKCGCPKSYHRGWRNECVMGDAGGGNCGCKHYAPKA